MASVNLTDRLRRLAFRLLPGTCALCDRPSGRDLDLCLGCESELPRFESVCQRCGLPLPPQPRAPIVLCGACLRAPPPYLKTVAPLRYTFPVDRLIIEFKFGGRVALGRVLASSIVSDLARAYAECPPDLLLPVPLHRRRLRERGFNQADTIARVLGRRLGINLAGAICERVRDTPAQSGLPAGARHTNLRAAFTAAGDLSGLRIAIVDDVVTTGTTASELARTLLAGGAREIHVWALARSTPPRTHRLHLRTPSLPGPPASPVRSGPPSTGRVKVERSERPGVLSGLGIHRHCRGLRSGP